MAVVSAVGALGFLDLPWGDQSFQVSGLSVVLYFSWSLFGRRPGEKEMDLPNALSYMVLLISALDSFLVGMTTFEGPWLLRWAGLGILSVGIMWCMENQGRLPHYAGRALLLLGFPLGLGSISGTVAGALAGAVIVVDGRSESEGRDTP